MCTEFEGFLEAEVWPVLCSLGCVLGWICSLGDVFPNLHKGLSALTAGLLRRPPEYLCVFLLRRSGDITSSWPQSFSQGVYRGPSAKKRVPVCKEKGT